MALDRTGRFVLVANYGEGAGSVTVCRVEPDGRLGDMTDHVDAGAGPDPVRQATSHAHMITSDPVTGDILVADLGSDTILVYSLGDEGRLTPKTASNVNAVPGAGPRHLAFHPDGRHLFVVNELDSTVSALRREDDGWVVTGRVRPRRPKQAAGTWRAPPRHPVRAARPGVQPRSRQPGRAAIRPRQLGPVPGRVPAAAGECPGTSSSPRTPLCHRGRPGQRPPGELGIDEESGALRLLHSAVAPSPVCLVLA